MYMNAMKWRKKIAIAGKLEYTYVLSYALRRNADRMKKCLNVFSNVFCIYRRCHQLWKCILALEMPKLHYNREIQFGVSLLEVIWTNEFIRHSNYVEFVSRRIRATHKFIIRHTDTNNYLNQMKFPKIHFEKCIHFYDRNDDPHCCNKRTS